MSLTFSRVSQQAARYTPLGSNAECCGRCRFYMAPSSCGRIVGPVSPRGWCKYYSREMVQTYGGSIIAFGTQIPAGATLDLSFMTPGTLDPSITFTRASTATYTDFNGVIQTAAVNVPRWDYTGGSLKGLLIEEARTNTTLQSANLGAAPWAVSFGGASSAPVVTGNNATAPDGTLTAARIVMPAVPAGANNSFVYQDDGVGTVPTAFSVWLRGAIGGEIVNFFTSNFITYAHTTAVLTTAWQRFSFVATPASDGQAVVVGTDMRDATQTPSPPQTIYAWGVQSESGGFNTSYIATTAAAVTRAQDQCGISPANLGGWWFAGAGTWFAEFIRITNPLPGDIHILSGPTEGNSLQIMTNQANDCLQTYDGANWTATVNTITPNAVSKGASSWAAQVGLACLNGGALSTPGTMVTGFGGLASVGVGFLTTSPTPGSANNMTGYIRRVSYWPRVLTNAEMQQVTT